MDVLDATFGESFAWPEPVAEMTPIPLGAVGLKIRNDNGRDTEDYSVSGNIDLSKTPFKVRTGHRFSKSVPDCNNCNIPDVIASAEPSISLNIDLLISP
jgi:hypothetical protein